MKLLRYGITLLLCGALLVGCGNDDKKETTQHKKSDTSQEDLQPAPLADLPLKDQNDNTVHLSDFAGKTVFMNFFTTWCVNCRSEMASIEKLYEETGENQGDVIVIGVANPVSKEHRDNVDGPREELDQFLKKYNVTFPVLIDEDGSLYREYLIRAFPTTFILNADNKVFDSKIGAMTFDNMKQMVEAAQK